MPLHPWDGLAQEVEDNAIQTVGDASIKALSSNTQITDLSSKWTIKYSNICTINLIVNGIQ